jgi:peptidoglycan-N-acetylglucosamine deacetylase
MRGHRAVDPPALAAAAAAWWWAGPWMALPVAAAAVAVHAWGALHPRSSLYLPVVWRLPGPELALTCDDGPHPTTTPAVLDRLAAAGQRATFFVIGAHVRSHPALVRRIHAAGHGLGLHSDTHARDFPLWSPARIAADLTANADAIADATGALPPCIFRPPMGVKTPRLATAIRRLGLTSILWTASARDGVPTDPDRAARRLARAVGPGAILTMHDGHEPTRPRDTGTCLAILDRLLPLLAERGLRSRPITA